VCCGFYGVCVCVFSLVVLRGVSAADLLPSITVNSKMYQFKNLHYFHSRQSGNCHILFGTDRRHHIALHYAHLSTIWVYFC